MTVSSIIEIHVVSETDACLAKSRAEMAAATLGRESAKFSAQL
jgi:hypothetical protein